MKSSNSLQFKGFVN